MTREQNANDSAHVLFSEDLPESLTDLVRVIGVAATLRLSQRFGGTRVYMPLRGIIAEDHQLARAIGLEAARKLAKLCAGDRLCVPRAVKAIRCVRDRALCRDYVSMSARQCARKYQMTERNVHSIIRRSQGKTQSKPGGRAAPDSNRIMPPACRPQEKGVQQL